MGFGRWAGETSTFFFSMMPVGGDGVFEFIAASEILFGFGDVVGL